MQEPQHVSKLIPMSIKHLSDDDQPRTKLIKKGMAALSNSELISILLNVGTKEKSVMELAQEILALSKGNLIELGKLSLYDFQKLKGIGESKATVLVAAIELGRRRYSSLPLEMVMVKSSSDVGLYLQTLLKDHNHEVFCVLFLNQANKIKHVEIISQGGITGTVADPRLILRKAVDHEATSLILSHNHPSGTLKPSRADEELTLKIKTAASYLDIKVLDHIIVSENGYYSFADEGIL